MGLTLRQAQAWRPETVQAVATRLREELGALGQTLDEAKTATNKAAAASCGAGEEARFGFTDRATAHGWAKHGQIAGLQQAIDEAGYGLAGAHGRLAVAVEAAARDRMKIWNDGSVTGYDEAKVRKHAKAIGQTLADLDDADQQYAQRIEAIAKQIGDTPVQREASGLVGGMKQEPEPPKKKWKYTLDDLYKGGHDGQPSDDDVQQDKIADCYVTSTMMAIARQDPKRIKDRIVGFDEETGEFIVSVWDNESSTPKLVRVGQQDLDTDIAKFGASKRDDGVLDAAIWPAVLECAIAKKDFPDLLDSVSMEHKLEVLGWGGFSDSAFRNLTGGYGHRLYDGMLSSDQNTLYREVGEALRSGHPVTLSTLQGTNWLPWHHEERDGLASAHAYEVTRVYEQNGEQWVELRNPWQNNDPPNTGEAPYGGSALNQSTDSYYRIRLHDLIDDRGVGEITIGDKL